MFVISRIEQYKFSSAAAVFAESERTLAIYDNPDFKPYLVGNNVYLSLPLTKDIEQLILDVKQKNKCRLSIDKNLPLEKQTNCFCQALFSASPEFFKDMNTDQIIEYYQHCFNFFVGRFPSVSVVSAVIHFDEVTPHLHINFLPLVEKQNSRGKLKTVFSSSDLFAGKDFFPNYQNDFFNYMVDRYPNFNLERKGEEKQTHKTVKEYKEAIHKVEKAKEELEEIQALKEEIIETSPSSLQLMIDKANLTKQINLYKRFLSFLSKYIPNLKEIFNSFIKDKQNNRDLESR